MKCSRTHVFKLILLVSAFFSGLQVVVAVDKVHVLLVCDTLDASIGKGIAINRDSLRRLFQANLPEERLKITVIEGPSVNWRKIEEAIESLEVNAENDTLLCHFSGHGGYDPTLAPNDIEQGHVLFLHQGSVTRAKFIQTLLEKKARLTILISDSCFNRLYVPLSPEAAPLWELKKNILLESLLFDWRGVVDVNGARRDTSCWYSWNAEGGGPGGWFTDSLVLEIEGGFEAKRPWTAFMSGVSDRTSKSYKRWKRVFLEDPNTPAHIRIALESQEDQRPQSIRPLKDLVSLSP